ncbi:hypothetical protein GCM10009092_17040 [Bowmanella denitrificans]|uniref:Uncharacterized protein n=1 Tax=Bowmanella denitrificans TaxID=366582 RepID=A0ABN0X2V1_9ALTE
MVVLRTSERIGRPGAMAILPRRLEMSTSLRLDVQNKYNKMEIKVHSLSLQYVSAAITARAEDRFVKGDF